MPDHARSLDLAVQAQLDRLWRLSPGADVLGLDRITRLLARLGDPHLALAPVFHAAGTNGKGSTCAFLRAALEAAGYRVHVYSSPHLVRFNERIRLAGSLIEDAALAPLLEEVLDQADGIGASFFEITTAAAFLAFTRTPADACVIEVGLGGRLDATNVVRPVVTGIAQLGIDHQSFLGETLIQIAQEKAGIAKAGIPLVTMDYPPAIARRIAQSAASANAPVFARGTAWHSSTDESGVLYRDECGTIRSPRPTLAGGHQAENYALAVAMLRHQQRLAISDDALMTAARSAHWPARMQRLGSGPLTDRLTADGRMRTVHVDGAHNVAAAGPVGAWWRGLTGGAPTAIIIGMLSNKDAAGVIASLTSGADVTIIAVPVADHEHHPPDHLATLAREAGARGLTAQSLMQACDLVIGLADMHNILIAGSLYLAGEALALNREWPT